MPLNDTGNYALYSNQLLDPELIDNVNVNLGSTDVDSPTASATGSTVNYRSRNPTEDFHARVVGSTGDFGFMRIFGVVDTGNITKGGLRAWLAASKETNDVFSGGVGKINKNSSTSRSTSRWATMATSSRWPATGTRTATTNALDLSVQQNYGSRTVSSSSSGRFPPTVGSLELQAWVTAPPRRRAAATCGTGNIATTPRTRATCA
jgi:iron complex outermembrane receptor protein